jgi:hypothetical protein
MYHLTFPAKKKYLAAAEWCSQTLFSDRRGTTFRLQSSRVLFVLPNNASARLLEDDHLEHMWLHQLDVKDVLNLSSGGERWQKPGNLDPYQLYC